MGSEFIDHRKEEQIPVWKGSIPWVNDDAGDAISLMGISWVSSMGVKLRTFPLVFVPIEFSVKIEF